MEFKADLCGYTLAAARYSGRGAVAYWLDAMSRDEKKAIESHKERMLEEELKKFMASVHGQARVAKPKWGRLGIKQ